MLDTPDDDCNVEATFSIPADENHEDDANNNSDGIEDVVAPDREKGKGRPCKPKRLKGIVEKIKKKMAKEAAAKEAKAKRMSKKTSNQSSSKYRKKKFRSCHQFLTPGPQGREKKYIDITLCMFVVGPQGKEKKKRRKDTITQ
jgi:hypothetical protein